MLGIFNAYGVPDIIVPAIALMYPNTEEDFLLVKSKTQTFDFLSLITWNTSTDSFEKEATG